MCEYTLTHFNCLGTGENSAARAGNHKTTGFMNKNRLNYWKNLQSGNVAEPTAAQNRRSREELRQLNGNITYRSKIKLASSIYVLDCGEIKI